jgi:YidC/Oxa1 family membrane protein insertase
VTGTVLIASTIGRIFQPFYDAMAWIIAGFYALVPNYAIAIALLTLVVMILTAPLTVKSTRSMLAMSKLQPEMRELQKKYKHDKVKLNEELMKLYREHDISPTAGCLPMVLQFPIFIFLYGVIEGLTNTVVVHGRRLAEPRYIGHGTALYQSLKVHPGVMNAFGLNLADDLFSHLSWAGRVPYLLMVVIAIGLQYLQIHQMNKRNGTANSNPQMQAVQKFMPIIFAIIYIRISAGVNVYFIVSSLCRIGLQTWAYRKVPDAEAPRVGKVGDGTKPKRKGLFERLAEAQQRALEQQRALQATSQSGPSPRPASGRPSPVKPPRTAQPPGVKSGSRQPGGAKPAPQKPAPVKATASPRTGQGTRNGGPRRRTGGNGTKTSPTGAQAGAGSAQRQARKA